MGMVNNSWPAPGRLNATAIADKFNAEISTAIDASVAANRGRPHLVGLLSNDDPAGEMYAKMTKRACEKIGVSYELRRPERTSLETELIAANSDPTVHGILTYYPVFGGGKDAYLRDVVSVEKDVEGLSHQYCYSLYHNIRYLEGHKKCVLPCTPLACVKVLEHFGAYDASKPVGKQLEGRTAIVYNRSEVVGRPLAAMLANDGARVFSVDEFGLLLYTAGAVSGTIKVDETSLTTEEALALADIVIGGVPSKNFKIPAASIRAGAICINVSQHMNFGDGTDARCALVPAVGKVTIAILARNLLRLFENYHAPPVRSVGPRVAAAAACTAIAVAAAAAAALILGKPR